MLVVSAHVTEVEVEHPRQHNVQHDEYHQLGPRRTRQIQGHSIHHGQHNKDDAQARHSQVINYRSNPQRQRVFDVRSLVDISHQPRQHQRLHQCRHNGQYRYSGGQQPCAHQGYEHRHHQVPRVCREQYSHESVPHAGWNGFGAQEVVHHHCIIVPHHFHHEVGQGQHRY